MDIGLDKREKLIKKWKRFPDFFFLLFKNTLLLFFYCCLFILGGEIFLDDLFRGLPRGTKVTIGDGLKVACFNVLLFFFLSKCFYKVLCETFIPTHFNKTKVVSELFNAKEFVIYCSCFQIPRFLVTLPDDNSLV